MNDTIASDELRLGLIVHPKRREGVVSLEWDRETIFVLVAVTLLDRNNELVEGFSGSAGEL